MKPHEPVLFVVVSLFLWSAQTLALDALRFDAKSAPLWRLRPEWLGNPSDKASLTAEDGVLHFHVPEPGKGMKWSTSGRPIDARYLVVRYRATNIEPKKDYLLYLDDGVRHGLPYRGINIIGLGEIVADGKWRYAVADLTERRVASFITTVAFQMQANKQGNAHVWVDYIAFVDRLPEGCKLGEAPVPTGPKVDRVIPLSVLSRVKPEPTWLSNPAFEGTFGASVEQGRLKLSVRETGKGMKWSLPLPAPVDLSKTCFVVFRYRAVGMRLSKDYILYLAPEKYRKPEAQYHAVKLCDVIPDGKWHTFVARLKPYRCVRLAFQVQARDEDAAVWLAPIVFRSHPPQISLNISDLVSLSTDLVKARIRPPEAKMLDVSDACNFSLSEQLATLDLKPGARFPQEVVVAEGIPFRVSRSPTRNVAVADGATGFVEVPVGEKASEVFLLLSLRLPAIDEPSYGGRGIWRITRPHRACVEIEYRDGTVDKCMPYRLGSGVHEVVKGLDAYCAPANPAKVIRRVKVWDGLPVGIVGLAGLTLNVTGDKIFPEAATIPPPVKLTRLQLPRPEGARAEVSNDRAVLRNGYLRLSLSLEKGAVVDGLEIVPLRRNALAKQAPLFEVESEEKNATSEEYRVGEARAERSRLWLRLLAPQPGLPDVELTLQAETDPRISIRARLANTSQRSMRPRFRLLSGMPLKIGEGDRYLYPSNAAVISQRPGKFRMLYGGAFPLQFVSLFNPEAGCGLYVMTRDREGHFKRFLLRRDGGRGATSTGVEFWPDPLSPGGSFETPPLDLGLNPGDWHGAFKAYKAWAKTWYRPLVPRKRWFREVFFFRQDYIHAGLFDRGRKVYQFERRVELARKAFGGCDYLHIFDWGVCGRRGRTGDYDPWREVIPGPDEFRKAVEALQTRGIPVGLYIEGYLVDHRSNVGRAHRREWGMRNAKGELMPYTPGSAEFILCPMAKGWQDYLAAVYRRVSRETGARGFYIDEFGFLGRFCYARDHGHPAPCHVLRGERELTRRVRLAVPRECVVYTEETPCDVNSQFQDGSFTYCVNIGQLSWLRPLIRVPLKMFRFAFPDFKTFEIIACGSPTGSNVEAVKQVFFNGEGLWIQGEPEGWFTPETLKAIRKCMCLLREQREAIASDDVEPLVPTLVRDVFANEFRGRTETVWTLYNANPLTVRGPVLSAPHVEGARYLDLWNGRELRPRIEGRTAVISLTIGPHDVGMVAQLSAR